MSLFISNTIRVVLGKKVYHVLPSPTTSDSDAIFVSDPREFVALLEQALKEEVVDAVARTKPSPIATASATQSSGAVVAASIPVTAPRPRHGYELMHAPGRQNAFGNRGYTREQIAEAVWRHRSKIHSDDLAMIELYYGLGIVPVRGIEIARAAGCSDGTVSNRIGQALSRVGLPSKSRRRRRTAAELSASS